MSIQDVLIGLIAILVCGSVAYFFILPSADYASQGEAKLYMDVLPTAFVKQPTIITITATSASGKMIAVASGEKKETLSCQQDPCYFSLTFTYAAPGTQTITARVDNILLEKKIEVTESVSRCLDGTTDGKCSTPPLHCEKSQLVSRCSQCGCPDQKICQNDSCVNPILAFSFISFDPPSTYYTGITRSASYTIQNTSGYEADGLFLLLISSYDATDNLLRESAQQVQLDALQPFETYAGTFDAAFPATAKFVRLKWYDQPDTYPSSTLLGESSRYSITVTTDTTPPLPPSQVAITSTGGNVTLSWNASPSNDVKTYRIYQQNFASGGFTTYSVLTEDNQSPYTFSETPESLAYVIRAVDYAGNESEPTQPVFGGAS
ncbi:MAG: hypothetical protein FJY86_00800 [Candidatus Diapherotrites archaeon]|uniref:Fibronectin type-III domain-containing protein n=1 Tax=Candidatus Iainarchaeum sp. TaxID=3101447 RepID=A0A8T4C6R3_9ARCH|nr:hypothetical protein [Candidatus Diapherotrites archaeon]